MMLGIFYISNIIKILLLLILIFIFFDLYKNRKISIGVIPLYSLLIFTILYTFISISINIKLIPTFNIFQEIILRPIGLGIVLSCFYLVIEYTSNELNKKGTVYGFISYFIFTLLFFSTNSYHYLLYSQYTTGADGYIELISTNLFFLFYIIPTSVMVVYSIFLISRYALNHHVSRKQASIITVGLIIGYVSISIESAVYTLNQAVDLDVLGVSMGVIIISYGLININTTNNFPLSREDVMDNINELIISVTTSNTISDITNGKNIYLEVNKSNIGDDINTVFNNYDINISDIINNEKVDIIETKNHNQKTYYKIKAYNVKRNINVFMSESKNIGSIIIVENITESKNKDEKIKLLKNIYGRILRHNIRNELNIVMGHTNIIQDKGCTNIQNNVQSINNSTSSLLDISKKSQKIEQIINNIDSQDKFNSESLIKKSSIKFTNKHTDVNINVNIHDSFNFIAHEQFELVLDEIIENGIEHNESKNKKIKIDSINNNKGKQIIIQDNGESIDNTEVKTVFNLSDETKLEHGSSLGLWLIKFIIDLSDLSIEFENNQNGTKVIIIINTE